MFFVIERTMLRSSFGAIRTKLLLRKTNIVSLLRFDISYVTSTQVCQLKSENEEKQRLVEMTPVVIKKIGYD